MSKSNSQREAEVFTSILEDMAAVYEHKNSDYGSSVRSTHKTFGIVAGLVRMSDKLNRLITLSKKKQQEVTDESIEDSLIDLGNYAVITLMNLRLDKEERSRTCMSAAPNPDIRRIPRETMEKLGTIGGDQK